MMKTPKIMAVVLVASIGFAGPARADLDPSSYFDALREDGFVVNANNASYLLQLAQIVFDMENAGYQDADIGDSLARRENLPKASGMPGTPSGYKLFLDASIYYCTQEHPRITP
jgi:hypothetical protein